MKLNPDGTPATDQDDTPEDEGKDKPPVAAPAGVLTKDEILGIVRETASSAATAAAQAVLRENALRGQNPAPPAIEDVTDEELESAVSEGRGSAGAIRKAIKAEAQRLQRGSIDPLAATGTRSLSRLALRAAMPDLPYYERFKADIDRAVANPPADRVGDPDFIVEVHNYLVGQNWKAIEAEKRESWEKERNRPAITQTPGSGRAGLRVVAGGKGGKLRPEDVFSRDELASLLDLGGNKNGQPTGRTWEEFCASLGRDPDEYLAKCAADREKYGT